MVNRFGRCFSGLFWITVLASLAEIACAAEYPPYGTTVFSMPARYCFNQSEGSADVSKVTLKHNVFVAPADHFKDGDIFIGYRQRSVPDVLWHGRPDPDPNKYAIEWRRYDPQQGPTPFFSGKLQPLTPVNIIPNPIDLSGLVGDAEVLAGYGLRTKAGATAADSYRDMLDNQRYYSVWVAGNSVGVAGNAIPGVPICLKATEMEVIGVTVPN